MLVNCSTKLCDVLNKTPSDYITKRIYAATIRRSTIMIFRIVEKDVENGIEIDWTNHKNEIRSDRLKLYSVAGWFGSGLIESCYTHGVSIGTF